MKLNNRFLLVHDYNITTRVGFGVNMSTIGRMNLNTNS